MDLQLKYKQLRPTGGDETAPYEVTTNRGCLLKELIEKIKSGTSHGNMQIYESDGNIYINHYEKTPIEDFPSNMIKKVVRRITAVGGWGRMDYRIWV